MRIAVGNVMRHARREAGGSARLRVVSLLAGVYALSAADASTVGALAPQLKHSLHVSDVQIGLIAGVAMIAAALGTLPAGVLTDRACRVKLLSAAILLWSAAMIAGALSPSFLVLMLTRVGLGAVTATCGPTVASLAGDLFPVRERARMLGLILTGDLVGAGIGIVISGDLASATSWRFGFAWLAIPGVALAVAIHRLLVEPARGGASRLARGAEGLIGAEDAVLDEPDGEPVGGRDGIAERVAREPRLEPHASLVLHETPERMPLAAAIRYVLRIRTNVFLIVSSSIAYLFFAGVRVFAVLLMRSRFQLGEAAATSLLVIVGSGGLVGLVVAGQLADRWTRRGRINARVLTGAIAYMVAALLLLPGLLSPELAIALPLLFVGAGALAAPDPTLGAARLDVMHPYLWGRAEGVRTFLHTVSSGIAPLLFGFVSDSLGGHGASSAATGGGAPTTAEGQALADTFLIMLAALAVAGLTLLRAARTYPRDVATAAASLEATAGNSSGGVA